MESDYESGGQEFESLRARHSMPKYAVTTAEHPFPRLLASAVFRPGFDGPLNLAIIWPECLSPSYSRQKPSKTSGG